MNASTLKRSGIALACAMVMGGCANWSGAEKGTAIGAGVGAAAGHAVGSQLINQTFNLTI